MYVDDVLAKRVGRPSFWQRYLVSPNLDGIKHVGQWYVTMHANSVGVGLYQHSCGLRFALVGIDTIRERDLDGGVGALRLLNFRRRLLWFLIVRTPLFYKWSSIMRIYTFASR